MIRKLLTTIPSANVTHRQHLVQKRFPPLFGLSMLSRLSPRAVRLVGNMSERCAALAVAPRKSRVQQTPFVDVAILSPIATSFLSTFDSDEVPTLHIARNCLRAFTLYPSHRFTPPPERFENCALPMTRRHRPVDSSQRSLVYFMSHPVGVRDARQWLRRVSPNPPIHTGGRREDSGRV